MKSYKLTQRQILLNHLKDEGVWIPSYKLQKENTRWGWLGSQADRQARLLAEEGLIERQRRGKYTFYRFKTPNAFGQRKESIQERRAKKHKEMTEALRKAGQESLL